MHFIAKSKFGKFAFWIVTIILLTVFVHFEGWHYLSLGWLLIFAGIAYEDLKSASYPLYLGIVFIVYSILLGTVIGGFGIMAARFFCGLALLSVSGALRKRIGMGDSLAMAGVLFALGPRAWLSGFFLAALSGVVQYVTGSICGLRKNAKMRVEVVFTPLLLIGTLLYALIE